MNSANSAGAYRSGRGLAWASIVITAIDAFILLITTVALSFYFVIVNGGSSQMSILYGSTLLGLSGFHILLLIGGTVVFLMWLYRAYQNLLAFDVKNLNYSPGWAVGYWFIPIVNLFRPLQVVNEIWHGSDLEKVDSKFNYGDTTTPTLHGFWWGLRILGAVADRLVTLPGGRGEFTEATYVFSLLSTGATFVSFVLLILIIRNINQRQELAGQNYDPRGTLPPLPPTFDRI